MVDDHVADEAEPYVGDTTRSPVVACGLGSTACAFIAIGILAAAMPRQPSLTWPVAFLAASVVLLGAAVVGLAGRRRFAWRLFFVVARWTVLLTGVFAAMAAYVFLYDGVRGATLTIMAVVLALAAVDVPLVLGFSVARHERVPG